MSTPTSPLPSAAVEALSRLERSSIAPAVVLAVNVYMVASARTAELSAVTNSRELTRGESDYLVHAQDMMAGARAALEQAGRLDLIGVA